MDNRVVVFKNGSVRIIHGIDPEAYASDPYCVINPIFPPGVSPDKWTLEGLRAGIQGSKPKAAPSVTTLKRPSKINKKDIILVLVSSILSIVTSFLIHKL